jgi:hypothetical protein
MKNAVFWDVAPCRSCLNRCFGVTYRLHLQGRKIRDWGTSVSRWQLIQYYIHTAEPPQATYTFIINVPHLKHIKQALNWYGKTWRDGKEHGFEHQNICSHKCIGICRIPDKIPDSEVYIKKGAIYGVENINKILPSTTFHITTSAERNRMKRASQRDQWKISAMFTSDYRAHRNRNIAEFSNISYRLIKKYVHRYIILTNLK